MIFGGGDIYVWNGTPAKVDVAVDGRTDDTFQVLSGVGKLERAVAGSYDVKITPEGGSEEDQKLDLEADALELINVGSSDCFARMDVSGEYQSGKPRAVVLEAYDKQPRISIKAEVHVFPGEPLPRERPKSPYAFQRLIVIGCDIVKDNYAIVELAQKLH
jgi:hypothetical protein